MRYTVELKRIEDTPYVGIRRRVRPPELSKALGEMLPAVNAHIMAHGMTPASPPVTIYHGHYPDEGVFDISGGAFLPRPMEPTERFAVGVLPAGEVASTVHVGPYGRLGEAHDAVRQWITENRRRTFPPCWEIYWTDPGEITDPALWRTEVVWPVR